jgi:hypothetical protein
MNSMENPSELGIEYQEDKYDQFIEKNSDPKYLATLSKEEIENLYIESNDLLKELYEGQATKEANKDILESTIIDENKPDYSSMFLKNLNIKERKIYKIFQNIDEVRSKFHKVKESEPQHVRDVDDFINKRNVDDRINEKAA